MSSMTFTIVVLLLLALAAFVLFRRKPQSAVYLEQPALEEPVKEPVSESINYQPQNLQPDVDQEVLNQLRGAGSDLSKPHNMEFLIYLPTEESANRVANRIRPDGFNVEVKRAAQGSNWLCLAMKRMAPKHSEIAAIGKRFSAIAQEFNGEYDGWETSIEK